MGSKIMNGPVFDSSDNDKKAAAKKVENHVKDKKEAEEIKKMLGVDK